MSHAQQVSKIKNAASEYLVQCRMENNPYFVALRDGSMSLEAFRVTQEQFFFAVTYFPRPMAILIGRIPDPALRLDILRNLVEEHGDFREVDFHHSTFKRFLHSLGRDPESLASLPIWPALRSFNGVLNSVCLSEEVDLAVACMGIIELAFAEISEWIGRAVVDRGWVLPNQLVHYKRHAEIDERHAEEFFSCAESGWDDPKRRLSIHQGLELGAYIFYLLYAEMHKAGTRTE